MARTLVFLHGWTMKGAIFDGIIARLSPEFTCVAPDLPGHGAAVDPLPTLDKCAEVVADCVTGMDERPVLVGWSMGAAVCWRYIERFGTSRLAGLVTVDMSPRVMPSEDWPSGLKGETPESIIAARRRFDTDWEGVTHGIAATMFAARTGAVDLARGDAQALIASQDPDKMRALWDELLRLDVRHVIPEIDIPYLVCSGAKSRVYGPGTSEWLVMHAPRAKAHVFSDSGHSPHLEEPDAFVDIVGRFARSLSR